MLHLASQPLRERFGVWGASLDFEYNIYHISAYFSKPFLDLLGKSPVFSGVQSRKGSPACRRCVVGILDCGTVIQEMGKCCRRLGYAGMLAGVPQEEFCSAET